MGEKELIDLSRQGNEEAFAELVGLHRSAVWRHCLSVVKDEEIAEDLTQEAFLQAYTHLPAFRQQARFSTWIWRIAHNLCLGYLKKHPNIEQPILEERLAAREEEHDPELLEQIKEAMKQLDEKHRIVFELYDLERIPQKEIAARLNIPHGTVRSRLHYARRKIREFLTNDLS